MPRIDIKTHHPNMFYLLIADSLTFIAVGALALKAPKQSLLAYAFIAPFFIIAFVKLYGVLAPHYRYVILGTILGFIYTTFFALGFSLSIVAQWTGLGVAIYGWSIPPWLLWSFLQFIGLKEPPENPLTDRTLIDGDQ